MPYPGQTISDQKLKIQIVEKFWDFALQSKKKEESYRGNSKIQKKLIKPDEAISDLLAKMNSWQLID